MLSCRTLTRGSPRKPRSRPFLYLSTRAATCATLMPRVRGADLRVEPGPGRGDRVSRHDRTGRGVAADWHDLALGVVVARLGKLDRHTLVGGQEGLRRRGLVEADHPGDVPVIARPGPEHCQHRANAVRRAERPRAVDAFEFADRETSRAHLGQQALLPGVAFNRRVRKSVHNGLRPEVARARRSRVVAVAGCGRTRLEVLNQRVAVLVGERLPDDLGSDDIAGDFDLGAVRPALQSWDLRYQRNEQRVADAENHREDDQHAQCGDVLPQGTKYRPHYRTPGMNWITRSMSLMPMNGRIRPPTP